MLKSLSIKNYLLIDSIDLNFESGFSVITGETGAGKSIILGAVSLLLGKRADAEIIFDKNKKCIIEAEFVDTSLGLKNIFEENDIDFEKNAILRREIMPEGKSRAFINDTPVNLSVLKIIGEKYLDLHSQHENLALGLMSYRTQIVDIAAKTTELYKTYQDKYKEYLIIESELKSQKEKLTTLLKEADYFKFQAEQIESAQIGDENELEYLEEQSLLLENATEIKASLINALEVLGAEQVSADTMLLEAKSIISKISSKYKQAELLSNRLNSVIIEIRDIVEHLSDDAEKAETNPALLDKVNSRIDIINKLLIKHQVKNIEELKTKHEEFRKYLNNADEIEILIDKLSLQKEKSYLKLRDIAHELSNKRVASFKTLESNITGILKELGMTHAVFQIQNNLSTEPEIQGYDNLTFLFSANKSVPPAAIEKIASGGEFSRLMLTLKSVIAEAAAIPTIIFDEIDTGVSGEIASKMAKIMKNLADGFQVISITHLPQIAAMGTNHYKVYKHTDKNRSYTNINLLSKDERLNEIASMISGEELSVQAIENAKILLKN
ncbi:MAG TPA: DNA repair protein RecN [Bacteroidales bacterium]|nr:DNA repair protein RecN [Bacteroidales bacterium]